MEYLAVIGVLAHFYGAYRLVLWLNKKASG